MHWGAALAEIIQFLLDSYHSLYPGHAFNWTMMMKTMGRCDTPKKSIENLLRVKQMHFPEQPIDCKGSIYSLTLLSLLNSTRLECCFKNRCIFCSYVACQTVGSSRLQSLADFILNMIHTADFASGGGNQHIISRIKQKLSSLKMNFPN